MITPGTVLAALAPATANAAYIEHLIAGATATLGHELGRYLGPVEQTTELHHGGRGMVLLYDDPVEDGAYTVKTRAYPTDTWEDAEATDYVLDGRTLQHATDWPRGLSRVSVTYTRGYNPGAGPAELRALVLQMVLNTLEDPGMSSETIGDYSYTRADVALLDDWVSLSKRWRRHRP